MTKKAWIVFGVICAVIIGGLIYLANMNKLNVDNIDPSIIQVASKQNGEIADHTTGDTNSKVVLIEYGDYQCPGCGSSAATIKEVTDKYKDKIAFVFRNFPLYSIHPNALAAATAAEAAGLEGKYWQMHDRLYANQSAWNQLSGKDRTDYFVSAATSIGLDETRFRASLDDPLIKKKIDFDHALGIKSNVQSTPSFYIDGNNVGDKYVKDGKLVPEKTEGASIVWADAKTFEEFVIKPALKAKGISVSE